MRADRTAEKPVRRDTLAKGAGQISAEYAGAAVVEGVGLGAVALPVSYDGGEADILKRRQLTELFDQLLAAVEVGDYLVAFASVFHALLISFRRV